jgi:hypothetical protein
MPPYFAIGNVSFKIKKEKMIVKTGIRFVKITVLVAPICLIEILYKI